jgi:hypothetical protein
LHKTGVHKVTIYLLTPIPIAGNLSLGMSETLDKKSFPSFLEGLGFSILRFENRLVFQEPEFVIDEIIKTFKERSGI